MLGIICRSFQHLTPTVFRMLYVSLVRPHLDYASAVRNPHLLKDIRALEAVQRRTTRMVPKLDTMSYIERLIFLNLPSLYYRRKRMDMIITYKIIHGLVCVPCGEFFVFNLGMTRSNGLKLINALDVLNKCHCVEQCKGKGGCRLCICVGCDGSSCQCDKDKCFCTKGCCITMKCSCANCVCGASCACGDKCKGSGTGCCPCVCQGCDGSACKCEKDKCFCDKGCCASAAKCSCIPNCVCGPSCACGDKCKGSAAGCCPCVCQGFGGSACKCEKDKCFCDKECCVTKS